MATSTTMKAAVAGVLMANSSPHLGVAAARRTMLTPLAGRGSSPDVNAVWGAANLAAGLVLIRSASRDHRADWPRDVRWFGIALAAWAVWMEVSESLFDLNADEG